MKHTGIKNPNRADANQLTIYRRGGGVKLFYHYFFIQMYCIFISLVFLLSCVLYMSLWLG